MALYCLCGTNNAEIAAVGDGVAVALERQMHCVKTGARQYIRRPTKPGEEPYYDEHYPNVDLFRCPHCGSYIAKE